MRNKIERILLSILLGTSILLGLSFWLNMKFGFNLFLNEHWHKLLELQATHTPINPWFYVSIEIAIFLFLSGLIVIYVPKTKHKTDEKDTVELAPVVQPKTITPVETQNIKEEKKPETKEPVGIALNRPPRLNLPKNLAEIITKKQTQATNPTQTSSFSTSKTNTDENPYNPTIAKIFTDADYVVKPNPLISGFTPNLFAIGNNEIVWIGGVDCKPETMLKSVQKLQEVFEETLTDIPIHIRPFIIDNYNTLEKNDDILIFHSIDELKKFVSENPADIIEADEQDNFNSYSEYIDTIIQYIKNL